MVLYKIDLTKTSILLRKSLPGILVRELDQLSASHKEVGQNKIKTVQTLVSVKIIIYKGICKNTCCAEIMASYGICLKKEYCKQCR